MQAYDSMTRVRRSRAWRRAAAITSAAGDRDELRPLVVGRGTEADGRSERPPIGCKRSILGTGPTVLIVIAGAPIAAPCGHCSRSAAAINRS
jgi:hypothetical protein